MQLIKTFLYFQDIVIFAFGSIKIKNVWSAANYDNIMVIRHTTDISPIAIPNFLLKGPNTHATAFRTPLDFSGTNIHPRRIRSFGQ